MENDIPGPEVIWARIALWHVLGVAQGFGQDDPVVGGRITFRSGGGHWATLIRYPGDRAVLFGWERHADTELLDEPYDPLAAAPPWVPIAELNPLVLTGEVGFAHWWESGRWHRSPVSADDGMVSCLGGIVDAESFDVDSAQAEIFSCAEEPDPCAVTGRDHPDMIRDLRETAQRFALRRSSFDLLCELTPDLRDTVFEAARRTLITEGSRLPTESVPVAVTGPRLRRAITESTHDEALVKALVNATELHRDPPPPTAELVRVLDQIATDAPGDIDRAYRVTGRSVSSSSAEYDRFDVDARLLWSLREAEGTEQGRWLFIRFRTKSGIVEVERAYDHWPHWYPLQAHFNDPGRHDIVAELAGRAETWRPDWAPVAADEYAYVRE